MTQAASVFSRKRPADGPLLPASPSKHARVTPFDRPKAVLAFVTGVFAPAEPALPLHNKPTSARYPIQNTTPRASTAPRRTPMPSKVVTAPPLPKSDDEALPTEPPRFHRKRSMPKDNAAPPPPSSTPPSIPNSSQPSPDKPQNASSNWRVPEPRIPDILNARSWTQLPCPSKQSTSSASSVASTSRVTLDSASSWQSTTDSATDRPSSATSGDIDRPGKKEDFSSLPRSLFPPNLSTLPTGSLPTSLASSRIQSASSTQVQPPSSEPSRSFKYTPKRDLHGPEFRYRSEFVREKPARRSRSRPHIYQDQHNRRCESTATRIWRKLMQKYTPEWFARAKKRGYEGSEEDFTAWADYTMRAMQAVHGAMKNDDEVKQGMDDHFAKIKLFKSAKKVLEGMPRSTTSCRPPKPVLPKSLPEEDEKFVKSRERQVVFADIYRLNPREWLNDEVINFYGALINARAEASAKGGAGVDVGKGRGKPLQWRSTLARSSGRSSLGTGTRRASWIRWTKKAKTHWTAGAVNFGKKRFESYDSMGIAKEDVTKLLRHYVRKEHEKKKGKPFNFDGGFSFALKQDIPQQDNGFDCGVFTCQFIEMTLRFTQENMPYLRRRMVWEIAHTKLRSD
ncbi:cysteine proteinase [Coprinellus micaceus]|uniref:Cysteine proteinase n=1 Tax=Coprinellus micaceus TaxID=71717 RepID=A0A4Y7TLZ9_COPMI|nr:cysteine proteinase [Coprinellus micaceus]